MSKTKIIVLSASGVFGAAATFMAGYFTGKSMERKRLLVQENQEVRESGQPQSHAHA